MKYDVNAAFGNMDGKSIYLWRCEGYMFAPFSVLIESCVRVIAVKVACLPRSRRSSSSSSSSSSSREVVVVVEVVVSSK